MSSASLVLPNVGFSYILAFLSSAAMSGLIFQPFVSFMQCSTGRFIPSWVFR